MSARVRVNNFSKQVYGEDATDQHEDHAHSVVPLSGFSLCGSLRRRSTEPTFRRVWFGRSTTRRQCAFSVGWAIDRLAAWSSRNLSNLTEDQRSHDHEQEDD